MTTNPTDAQMKLADVTDADVTAALPTESELKLARKCTARANFLLEKKTLQSILNGEQDTWPEVVASILAIRATEARAQGLVDRRSRRMTPTNPTDAQMKLADFKAEWRKDMSEREIEALAGRMRANPEIKAPCQGYPGGIPWETHMRAYEVYCAKYRGQVALVDLFGRGCRGGFAVKELDAFIPGWRDELSLIATLNARIQATEARAQGLVEWQDISTAPKDGTHILVCRRANYSPQWGFNQVPPTVAHWWNAEGEQGFYASVDSIGEHALDCSHWKPLGDPPIAGRAITADTQIGERCKMCGTAAPDHFSKECHRPDCAWRAKHSQHGGEREY